MILYILEKMDNPFSCDLLVHSDNIVFWTCPLEVEKIFDRPEVVVECKVESAEMDSAPADMFAFSALEV